MDENLGESDGAVISQQSAEKLIPQSQVDAIVKREKLNAADKARREVEAAYQSQQERNNQNSNPGIDDESLNRLVSQKVTEAQEQNNQRAMQERLQREMEELAQSYVSKVNVARGSYGDFDEVMKDFDPTAFPQLLYITAKMDNGAHIMYELAKNPQKLVTINSLAKEAPRQAMAELAKLSQSITVNQQAQANADANAVNPPLDRLQSSRTNSTDGKKTISDLRNEPWLRG